jgi:glutaredoxin 3
MQMVMFETMKIIKHPKQITLYTRPMCGWCIDAKEWLDEQGLEYTMFDVGADLAARQRAIELSGQECVPVIKVDGYVLGDFDVGQLQEILKKYGYLD